MAKEPARGETPPATAHRRTVRLSEYMREKAEDPVHQRSVADIERQILSGELKPLDADGIRALFRRSRPS